MICLVSAQFGCFSSSWQEPGVTEEVKAASVKCSLQDFPQHSNCSYNCCLVQCEPFADCLPWRLVWHVRVLSGPCCPCCALLLPVLASSCPIGCWEYRWTSQCPLALSVAAPTQWGMKRARPRWCWSSVGGTPPSTASRVLNGGSVLWWQAWDVASSCWWRSQLSWAAASLTSSHVQSVAWLAVFSLLVVSIYMRVCVRLCAFVHARTCSQLWAQLYNVLTGLWLLACNAEALTAVMKSEQITHLLRFAFCWKMV